MFPDIFDTVWLISKNRGFFSRINTLFRPRLALVRIGWRLKRGPDVSSQNEGIKPASANGLCEFAKSDKTKARKQQFVCGPLLQAIYHDATLVASNKPARQTTLQMSDTKIISQVPDRLKDNAKKLEQLVAAFVKNCQPLEQGPLHLLADCCTDALFCECHIKASVLVANGTVDVPLDPEEQVEYRANRDLVEDHVAYERMKADAFNGRAFSNLVIEYHLPTSDEPSLMVIGGHTARRLSRCTPASTKKRTAIRFSRNA